MAALHVMDPFKTFFNLLSTAPTAGGRADLFEAGTITPKAVYANPELTVSNRGTVDLYAASRLEVHCCLPHPPVRADETLVKELDDIQPAGGASFQIGSRSIDARIAIAASREL